MRDIPQAGAICYRRNKSGQLKILLVGSRRNGRWGVPKGHIEPGETGHEAALREAFEEAGVTGLIGVDTFGTFSYRKDSSPHNYIVAIHLLEVTSTSLHFPENTIRKQKWFPLKIAIREVAQPGLRSLFELLR
jgi:8-oxo-dGTP pyrophosphatase MutT (NUDIX family)